MANPEILVRGVGEASVLPDRAILQVIVNGEGATQEQAYAETAKSVRGVDSALDRFADAIDKRTTTGLTVLPKHRWKKGESIRAGYRGQRVSVVEVTDLAKLGELLAELAKANPSAISGPEWRIDPGNAIHDAVRKQAVEDARRRAASYAEGLDLNITGIAWVSEPGLRQGIDEQFASMGAAAAGARYRGGQAEEPIEITVEEIRVRSSVEIAFETQAGSEAI